MQSSYRSLTRRTLALEPDAQIFKEFVSNSYRNRTRTYLTEDSLDLIWSLTVAIFAIGGMLGGISGGLVADWCGRWVPSSKRIAIDLN